MMGSAPKRTWETVVDQSENKKNGPFMAHQADAITRLSDEHAIVVEGAYLIVDD